MGHDSAIPEAFDVDLIDRERPGESGRGGTEALAAHRRADSSLKVVHRVQAVH